MTPEEARLWLRLRALRPQGFHFRRQVPRGRYVLDFACLDSMLAIELDGFQHGLDDGARRDAARDCFLAQLGFHVLRFWNHEVREDIDAVVETIFHYAAARKGAIGLRPR